MKVRSPRLVALAIVMIGSGSSLAGILQHDGQLADPEALLWADEGDDVVVKSELRGLTRTEWLAMEPLRPLLSNHTYIGSREPGLWVVITHDEPLEPEVPLVIHGPVVYRLERPDATIVLVHADRVDEPILFR